MNSCPCGMPFLPTEIDGRLMIPYGREWHVLHLDRHLAAFPDVDQRTRDNLTMMIERVA